MSREFRIGKRRIGAGFPCFIIAEAGVNHNGNPASARRLVDAAVKCGADAVKFQTWVTEKLVTPGARMAEYQKRNVGEEQTQFQMLKSLELSYRDFEQLKAYADRKGILFLSTPDEEDSADFLFGLGVPVFKIGSGEITNLPFIRHIAKKKRPVILSTGMSTLAEVSAAVGAVRQEGNRDLLLLHCVSNYPADPADCNLRAMLTMAREFGVPVGYSDHTLGVDVAVAAVAMGACVIEKHLTLDRNQAGPDHKASMDVSDFADMVRAIRVAESALGTGVKVPAKCEMQTRKVVRKVLTLKHNMNAGTVLKVSDVVARRASTGIPPDRVGDVEGRRLRRSLAAGTVLKAGMLK